jgi:hypothetical protein
MVAKIRRYYGWVIEVVSMRLLRFARNDTRPKKIEPTELYSNQKGQAAIELALSLPFLIWLIFYTINAFYSIHTAHVGQKYAAMSLYDRISHRAKFVVDDREGRLHGKEFMAVQYQDAEGGVPKRKILTGPIEINTVIGICREPGCR